MTNISIALATLNGARFIAEQLHSFATQTLLPSELVVADDGSTDETLDIIEQFAGIAPFPVRVHRNPTRLGYSRNFEVAIELCRGDIIFLSDQDDVWFPDKLATVVAQFEAKDSIEMVINGQIITDAGLNHEGITMFDNVRRLGMTSDGLIEGCCTAFRRRWSSLLLPIPIKGDKFIESRNLSHDQWLNHLSLLLGVRAFIERPLQFFRRSGDNATQWIGNTPNRVGIRDVVASRVSRPPIEAWLRRSQVLELYEEWLAAHSRDIEAMGIGRVRSALTAIGREKDSLETRAALVCLPLSSRIPRIWQLWRLGGYCYFYGWKSALRDLTRAAL